MKRFVLGCLMAIFAGSLLSKDVCESGQCYYATVNGKYFQLRNYWPIGAMLYRQQGSLDGRRPTRDVISIMLNGNSYPCQDGKLFNESIQFEIKYEENKTGVPEVYTVTAQYNSQLYSVIRDSASLVITDFRWEPDSRSFRISIDVNCRMFAWGYPLDGKHELHLVAKLSDVLITVPAWMAVTQK